MTTRQSRLLRAFAASGVATTLAAVSHTIGGGAPPHPLLIVAVSVLLVPLAAALIGRRPSRTRTAATVSVAQLVFHLIFHATGGTLRADGMPLGHVHEVVLGPAPALATPDAVMVAAHVVAAVFTTVLLWHGERMLRGIAAWARAALPAVPELPSPRHPALLVPSTAEIEPRLAHREHSLSPRAPPHS